MAKSKTVVRGYFPDGSGKSVFTRNWQGQKKPYKAPLPFSYDNHEGAGTVYAYNNGVDVAYPNIYVIVEGMEFSSQARNRSYDQLSNSIGSPSQWANNLLEANESIAMVVGRAKQLGSFAQKLRKGDLAGAAKALGSPQPGGKGGLKGKAKSFGDQFLEYHFGWEPLFKDIHDACETLSKPHFGTRIIKGSGSDTHRSSTREAGKPGGYDYLKTTATNSTFHMRQVGIIRVSNPNAFLASQLGLVNPLSIAWEAVPFSFVADWFGNIGQCLSAMTDFVGLEVISGYTTLSVETQYREQTIYLHPNPNIGGSGQWGGKHFYVERAPGFSLPTLALKPFKGLSTTRGATAISLLLQTLR
jgi:hypothetical protein